MIIDVHTHYGVCFEERDGTDPTRWLSALDEEGIDGAVVAALRGLFPGEDVPACNDALAQIVARAPHRLIAFGSVHPFAAGGAVAEAERCFKVHGMKGLKLHPWLQGFLYLGGTEMHELCEVCDAQGKMLLFHDGTSNVSMPSQVATLAKAHPRTTFILGHAGLIHLWRQAAEAAALYENVYIVLCGPHVAAMRHVCRNVPMEKIMWGSDYGPSFAGSPLPYRKAVMAHLGLGTDDYNAVMGGNAARLLDWRPRRDG